MKLTLTDNDGVLLERWNVEEDFGDISKPVAAHMMLLTLVEEMTKYYSTKSNSNSE